MATQQILSTPHHKKKVRQSNDLVESPYSQEFSEHEIKIFEITMAFCTQEDMKYVNLKNDKEFYFSNSELAKLLNTSPSVISQKIENTASRIMKKSMHLRKIKENGEVEFEMINLIPYARYKDGILCLRLNWSIIPYVVEINKNFTEYQLHYLLSLRSSYAIKLYKLLYQYKNIKSRTFSLIELKKQFGIPGKYERYNDLKKDIIEVAVSQINNLTDLHVTYKEIKLGRKVEKVEFKFGLNNTQRRLSEPIQASNDVCVTENLEIDDSIEAELSTSTKALVKQYLSQGKYEYVESSIKYAKRNSKSNFDKYLADTLTKGWADLEIKKEETKKKNAIAKVEKVKLEENKKKQEKEQENLAKSEIEHEWNKLLDTEKQNFIDYSNFIIKKHNSKLTSFTELDQKLPLSIFAVTNNKFYDRSLEGYIKHIINISLNINNFIAN